MTRSRLRPNLSSTTSVSKRLALLDAVVLDVALLLEEAGDLLLHPRGRHRRVSCSALLALRMRVSMSAIGSVSIVSSYQLALRHARDRALVRELAQADPAEAELPEDRARAAAAVAARVRAHLVLLRLALLLDDQRLLGHTPLLPPALAGERQAEAAQQRERLLVRLRGGRDRDVEAADRATSS